MASAIASARATRLNQRKKTNAVRALEANGVAHRVIEYDAGDAFHSAADAASLLGVPAECVYKTLVVLREDDRVAKPLAVMIRAEAEVDLRLLASGIGAKKVRMASQREAERLTSMRVGAISPLGLRAGAFEVLIDEAARDLAAIYVSGGARGAGDRAFGRGRRRSDASAVRAGDAMSCAFGRGVRTAG